MILHLIFILFSLSVLAQVHITPADPDLDLDQVPSGVIIDRKTSKAILLTPVQRDEKLQKLFPSQLKNFDDVDRDILYKSILELPPQKLFHKYPFINQKNYQAVKDAFK